MSVSLEIVYSEVLTFEKSMRAVWGSKLAAVIPEKRHEEFLERVMQVLGDTSPEGMTTHMAIINDVFKEVEPYYDITQFGALWHVTADTKAIAKELERLDMQQLALVASHAARPNMHPRQNSSDALKP